MVRKKRKRIGLALGAGGARGLVHVGVLKVFEQEEIPIDLIAGSSIGALVGAAYASGGGADELGRKVEEYLESPEFQSSTMRAFESAHEKGDVGLAERIQTYFKNRFYVVQAMFKPGILSNEDFRETINYFIPDIQIEETPIPFRAVATDLKSGRQIIFSEGSLRQAVMASCAVPGAIEPLEEGDWLLSDGGIMCLIPSFVARAEGADIVIAVAVDREISADEELRTVVDIYHRVSEIMGKRMKNYELMDADIAIFPEVMDLHWSSFSQAMSLIEEGEKAARARLDEIRNLTAGTKKWFNLQRLAKWYRSREALE